MYIALIPSLERAVITFQPFAQLFPVRPLHYHSAGGRIYKPIV